MRKVLAIAYDFVGALDIGNRLAETGLKVFISIARDFEKIDFSEDSRVTVVDAESYGMSPEREYALLGSLCRTAIKKGIEGVFLKTDSSLRGNAGIEIKAVKDAFGGPVIFAPAYPQANKTTRGCIQYVGDTPLHLTGRAEDALNPVGTSDVGEILRMQANLKTVSCLPDNSDYTDNDAVYICDALSREDLYRIAMGAKAAGAGRVLAGCSGFGEFLREILSFNGFTPGPFPDDGLRIEVKGPESVSAAARRILSEKAGCCAVVNGGNQAAGLLDALGCAGLSPLGKDASGMLLATASAGDKEIGLRIKL